MLEDAGTLVGEGNGTIPLRTGCENENVVADAFARGQHDTAVATLFALLDGSDAANLDGAVVLDEETVVRDEGGLFEFALRGGRHADGRGKMERKGTRSHEGEARRVGVYFGRENASDGRTSCATTDDYDRLAGHCIVGLEKRIGRKEDVVVVVRCLGGLSVSGW